MRRCRIVIWCNPPQVMQTDMKLGKLKLADANSPKIQSSECTAGCSWLESFREQSLDDRYRELYMNYKRFIAGCCCKSWEMWRVVAVDVACLVALMFFFLIQAIAETSNKLDCFINGRVRFSLQLLRSANGHVRPLMIWFDMNCKLFESSVSGWCGPINENSQECELNDPTFLRWVQLS